MITIEQDITRILTQTGDEIRANMDARGINASHRTEQSIQVQQYDGGIRLVLAGTDHAPLTTLEVGRPGGNVPGGFRTTKAGIQDVSNLFKWMLVEWAREKGFVDFGWAQATVLGRKIAYDGTDRQREPIDIYSTPVQKAKEEIRKEMQRAFATEIHNAITHF